MLIFGIFIAIIVILVYIYGGLRLAEDIDTPSIYNLFWIAYILLGMTIATIVMLGKFWSVLLHKTGPPGPRGIPGEQGDKGLEGECSKGHNIYYAMKVIKKAIADEAITRTGTPSATNEGNENPDSVKQLTMTEIYDPVSNRLTNVFLDNTVNRMVTSKQFEILLELPIAELERLPAGKRKTFGKSLEDLSGYMAATWREWISELFTRSPDGMRDLLTNPGATLEDDDRVVDYLQNEIEKYDIWYWGTTRVFRPLEAEICRANTIEYNNDYDNNGNKIKRVNTRFPGVNTEPSLEIIEIEFSAADTSKLEETWNDRDMQRRTSNWEKWKNRKPGLYKNNRSRISAYIPKPIQQGNKWFYPVGQVVIDGSDNTVRKTILVSGDVVIPDADRFVRTWIDETSNYTEDGDAWGVFYRPGTSQPGYICIGDYFESNWLSPADIMKKYNPTGYLDKLRPNVKSGEEYKGLVCLPEKCIEEIPRAELPIWANQYNCFSTERSKYQVDIFTAADREKGYNIARTTGEQYCNLPNKKFGPQPGDGKFYRIKPECIKNGNTQEALPLKNTEKEFSDVGMGWFGHPYKMDRKYSIFAFLGIMPEGIIVHRDSANRFYIRHYGGMEPNKFVVLNWDGKSKDFNNAFRVKSSSLVDIGQLNLTDERQQWRVNKIGNDMFRLASVMYPNKVLWISSQLEPKTNYNVDIENKNLTDKRPRGITVDQTRLITKLVLANNPSYQSSQPNNKTLFANLPAYGTDMDILDEDNAKPIDRTKSIKEQQIEERKKEGQTDYSYIKRGSDKSKSNRIDNYTYTGNDKKYTNTPTPLLNLINQTRGGVSIGGCSIM